MRQLCVPEPMFTEFQLHVACTPESNQTSTPDSINELNALRAELDSAKKKLEATKIALKRSTRKLREFSERPLIIEKPNNYSHVNFTSVLVDAIIKYFTGIRGHKKRSSAYIAINERGLH